MSRIELDINNRETQRALNLPHYFHQAIENSFIGLRKRRLWRIDYFQSKVYLMIVSEDLPELSEISQKFSPQSKELTWNIAEYLPFLKNLKNDQCWHFRLSANPVKSSAEKSSTKEDRGKIRAHVSPEHQIQWLLNRADSIGVEFDADSLQVVNSNWFKFRKNNGAQVTFRKVTFEGLLAVKDPDLLREKLSKGIGRQKAYGCGLMTLAPLRSAKDEGSWDKKS